VVDIVTDGSVNANEALRLAASVERDSEHSIAQGIVNSAEERKLAIPKAEQFEAIPGHGVRAVVEGKEFYVGGPAMLRRLHVTPATEIREAAERAAARGQASVYLLTSTSAIAAFAVADAVRPESRDAIQRLHDQRIEVVMLTGDGRLAGRRKTSARHGIRRGAAGAQGSESGGIAAAWAKSRDGGRRRQ
jgi:Cu2+-exporting ATPase